MRASALRSDIILATSGTSGKLGGMSATIGCYIKKGLWKRTADLNPSRLKPTEGGIKHIKHQSDRATAAVSQSPTHMKHCWSSGTILRHFVQRSQSCCQLTGTFEATFFFLISMCVTFSISPLFNQLVSNDYPQQKKRKHIFEKILSKHPRIPFYWRPSGEYLLISLCFKSIQIHVGRSH